MAKVKMALYVYLYCLPFGMPFESINFLLAKEQLKYHGLSMSGWKDGDEQSFHLLLNETFNLRKAFIKYKGQNFFKYSFVKI